MHSPFAPVRDADVGQTHDICGWGRFPASRSKVLGLHWQDDPIRFDPDTLYLPFGLGRSYGDSCLNDGQSLLATRSLNRFISFNSGTGLLAAEAGVSFAEILDFAVPRGWFLPVTPGTRFVTLGGAIANDVHGKNHHCAGTFGNHVTRFCLRRSDGSSKICSPDENPDWFRATVGGLGLTGLILWAEVRLKRIANSWIDTETIPFRTIGEFLELSGESGPNYEYLVAWTDALTAGRGLLMRGNHNRDEQRRERTAPGTVKAAIPLEPSFRLLNRLTLKVFNGAYYRAASRGSKRSVASLGRFFYPLDSLGHWNRLYGPKGLVQWQCLIPLNATDLVPEILAAAAHSGSASFLTVLKVMGPGEPPGILSFSGAGITLALDFAYDDALLPVLERLDQMLAEAGGRLYPAKDARMSGVHFRRFYPQWSEFRTFVDPAFSSSFWRRVIQ